MLAVQRQVRLIILIIISFYIFRSHRNRLSVELQREEDKPHVDEANPSHRNGIHDNNAVSSLIDVSGDRPENPLPSEKLPTEDFAPYLLRLEEDSPPPEPKEEFSEQPARKVYTPPKKTVPKTLSTPHANLVPCCSDPTPLLAPKAYARRKHTSHQSY